MKIRLAQIPLEGVTLKEKVASGELDIDTELVSFVGPLELTAEVSRITNAVTVHLCVRATVSFTCGRCIERFSQAYEKEMQASYQVQSNDELLDIGEDIREEILLDYPIQPLCKEECLGLCPSCGANLNESKCNCKVKS
jgi:uncharacterized protein